MRRFLYDCHLRNQSKLQGSYGVHTNLRSSANSCDLSSQVVGFISRERRVAYYSCFQVASEKLLDLSTAYDLSGCNRWKFRPWLA